MPWVRELLAMLDDGEWHVYQETIEAAAELIPAHLGWEKGEYYRAYHYTRDGRDVPPRKLGTDQQTINTGRRILMARMIRVLVGRRIVILDYEDPKAARKKAVRIKSNGT